MTTRKLLIVTTIPDTIESFLLPFAQHFRRLGWQVDAMAQGVSQSTDCLNNFDQVWDVPWSRNPLDPRNLLIAAPTVRKRVEQEQYDLVHVHTPVAAFVTRWALRHLRQNNQVKVVYTAHGFHFHRQGNKIKNGLYSQLEKLAGPWTDSLIVINRDDQQAAYEKRLVQNALGQGNRVTYMPGIGVDLNYYSSEQFAPDAVTELYQELDLPVSTPLIVCVAEFIARKRHADLLYALANVPSGKAHLLLAGDGPLRSAMEQLAKQLNIHERVHFLGNRRDVPRLLKAASIAVLASEQEGLPRCVLESMAIGTPVIGTRIRGTADLLAAGGGLLVELGDRLALSQALSHLLENPALTISMGQQGQEQAQIYDVKQIIARQEQVYEELLAGQARLQITESKLVPTSPFSVQRAIGLVLKSIFDRTAAALGLILFSPIMVIVALAIYFTMGGQVLFKQQRPGKDGRIFSLYKFRTMVPGDETAPDVHRITPLGDWLRRLSLDELPQLLNVLKGDMSIIGPRPLMVSYLPRYDEHQAHRHDMKPGITGLAQVSGRNAISWDKKLRLDLEYINNWSLGLDLKVFYLTLLKVLGQADINQGQAGAETMPDFWGTMSPRECSDS